MSFVEPSLCFFSSSFMCAGTHTYSLHTLITPCMLLICCSSTLLDENPEFFCPCLEFITQNLHLLVVSIVYDKFSPHPSLPFFSFNTCSPNVCSGLFHPLSRGSWWAERMLTPLLGMSFWLGHLTSIPDPPGGGGMFSRCPRDNGGSWGLVCGFTQFTHGECGDKSTH